MNNTQLIAKLLSFTESTIFKWKKENRPILNLLQNYFTNEEIKEFLETGKVLKQEVVKNLSIEDINNIKSLKNEMIFDEIKRTKERLKYLESQIA